ncbi:MAG: ABC transporter ATP-binding protein [Treponema sp.]|nr:ABC transporter ATP-binding protein [Treponema sp.]
MLKSEKKTDPLVHEYGLFSNIVYIIKKILKYKKSLLVLILIASISSSAMKYIWTFIGKYIIDLIQRSIETNTNGLNPLLKLITLTSLVELLAIAVNSQVSNKQWYRCIYVRMMIIKERIAKALTLNYQQLESSDTLDLMQKAMNATNNESDGVEGMIHSISDELISLTSVLVGIGIIITLNPLLILVIFVLITIQFLFMNYIQKKDKIETWDKLAPFWRKIYYVEQKTQDFSYGKDIRLYNMNSWLKNKQQDLYKTKHEHIVKSKNYWIANSTFALFINLIRSAIIYSWLIYSVIEKGMSIGNVLLYIGSIETFSSSLLDFFWKISQFKKQSLQVDDFRSFMDLENLENKDAIPLPKFDKWTFTFENVSFKYPNQENYSLKNINLTIPSGEKLAIVGLNGAGKTTFVKLLLRLYDVTEGRILLNGVDVKEYKKDDYFKIFSPIFQDVQIFAFPLCENVSMSEPEKTDSKLAEDYLRSAGLGEKIDSLPKGVHTELLKVIEEDGIDLSGGEKQKLALARALYKNAPIVVLDEPTAALDALAEYHLYQNFNKMIGEKSAVYISHRLSSTRFCDKVAMFMNGNLVEYGTHESLLQKNGEYAHMFEVQAQYYKDGKNALGEEITDSTTAENISKLDQIISEGDKNEQ